ncbi:MAG: hypothetical protein ABIG63_21370 [Chloroflexota bacterium]
MRKPHPILRAIVLAALLLTLACILTTSSVPPVQLKVRSEDLAAAGAVKISVLQEGIYQISLAELGWENIDPATLQLVHRNQPQPLLVTGEGTETRIHFYGQPSDSIYTNENIYLLQTAEMPGLRMVEAAVAAPPPDVSPLDYCNIAVRAGQLAQEIEEKFSVQLSIGHVNYFLRQRELAAPPGRPLKKQDEIEETESIQNTSLEQAGLFSPGSSQG